MADTKLTGLTAIDAVVAADLFYVVDDPAGTPTSKKATAQQIADFVGIPRWEVIGDTTVSSPVASITHSFDPANYPILHIIGSQLVNASDDAEMLWGFQFQQSGGTIDGDFAGAFVISEPGSGTGAIDTMSVNGLLQIDDAASARVIYELTSYAAGGLLRIVNNTSLGVNVFDTTATAKIVYFYSKTTSDLTVATATNTTAGRLITLGMRLPS